MGVAGRVKHTGFHISHVGDDVDHLQRIHEFHSFFTRTFQSERNHATATFWQIFLIQRIIFVGRQPGKVNPPHFGARLEPFSHLLRILAVLTHSHMQALQTNVEHIGILWTLAAAEVAHKLGCGLGDVGKFAEILGVGQAVVALVGQTKSRELVGVRQPVEIAAVHYHATHTRSMSVHIFGGGVHHYVGTPLYRAAVDRRGKSVVDYQRHPCLVGNLRISLNVEHRAAGVGDGFAKNELGVRLNQCLHLIVGEFVGVEKRAVHAHLLHRHAKQIVGTAIDIASREKVSASLADVERREKHRRHAARCEHSRHTAFKRSDFRRHGIVGGILQPAVEIARLLQVEQTSHLIRVLILKSG